VKLIVVLVAATAGWFVAIKLEIKRLRARTTRVFITVT
jgi:hypothetical protein